MAYKLIGVADTASGPNAATGYFYLQKFTCEITHNMTEFRVRSTVAGNVKCALYADNGGEPGVLITAMNDGQAVLAGQWNVLSFTSTPITKDTVYWLAICIDTAGAAQRATTGGVRRYKTATYSTFTFPNPAGTGFTADAYLTIVAGWSTNLMLAKFYPDPHIEIATVDGYVFARIPDAPPPGGTFWEFVRNHLGNGSDSESGTLRIEIWAHSEPGLWKDIWRSIMLFDTSSIPVDAAIWWATLQLTLTSKVTVNGWDDFGAVIVASNPESNTNIWDSDYQRLSDDPLTNAILWPDISSPGAMIFTFKQNKLDKITKGGITKLGIRESTYDCPNVAPEWHQSGYNIIYMNSAEAVGTINDPTLSVFYAEGEAPPVVGEAGHVWVEGTGLHYLDAAGEEKTKIGVLTGQTGVAGHIWIEGDYFHYIDESGDERRCLGVVEGAVDKIGGHIWVESTKLCYIDASGNERYL